MSLLVSTGYLGCALTKDSYLYIPRLAKGLCYIVPSITGMAMMYPERFIKEGNLTPKYRLALTDDNQVIPMPTNAEGIPDLSASPDPKIHAKVVKYIDKQASALIDASLYFSEQDIALLATKAVFMAMPENMRDFAVASGNASRMIEQAQEARNADYRTLAAIAVNPTLSLPEGFKDHMKVIESAVDVSATEIEDTSNDDFLAVATLTTVAKSPDIKGKAKTK